MLKKIAVLIMIMVFSIAAVSCGLMGSTTEKYLKSFESTYNADSMYSKTEYKINMDVSNASNEVKDKLEPFKEITINMDEAVDNRNKRGKTKTFFSAGEIIMDLTEYWDEDSAFIKSSFLGDKYLNLNSMNKGQDSGTNEESYKEYEELYNELAGIWKNAIENEVLASEGSTIKNTPDGDIKVTQLSLELTDEKAKKILEKMTEAISNNDRAKKMLIENSVQFMQKDSPGSKNSEMMREFFENLPENFDRLKDKFSLDKLKLIARIDRDYHIIDESIEGTLLIKSQGEIRIDLTVNTTRWNINGPVKVEIPDVSEEDMLDFNSINPEDLKINPNKIAS